MARLAIQQRNDSSNCTDFSMRIQLSQPIEQNWHDTSVNHRFRRERVDVALE